MTDIVMPGIKHVRKERESSLDFSQELPHGAHEDAGPIDVQHVPDPFHEHRAAVRELLFGPLYLRGIERPAALRFTE